MDIYEEIRENLIEGEAENVINLINKALAVKYPPEKILQEGLIKGIQIVADKFKTEMVLIPEALMASRALNAGLECLEPYVNKNKTAKCRAIIGTVEGDFHDIGKNIVKSLVTSLDIEVLDLGIDTSKEDFIKAIKEFRPHILMISALLTTTMKQMEHIIEKLEEENLRDSIFIFVGGAPVTGEYAEKIGADYYTENAIQLRNYLDKNLHKLVKRQTVKI